MKILVLKKGKQSRGKGKEAKRNARNSMKLNKFYSIDWSIGKSILWSTILAIKLMLYTLTKLSLLRELELLFRAFTR
jgi:hypothetical protein